MKRILISLLLATLPSTAFARPTALTYALIRILQNGTCIAKATRPIVPKATEALKPLFIWSDSTDDSDLEGAWDHEIICDIETPTDKTPQVIMTSLYTLIDFHESHTKKEERRFATNLSNEISHRSTFEGEDKIVVEMSFTNDPQSVH
jgi:hypothetical protein